MFLKPDLNINSIFDIDKEDLKNRGIKAIFFDLDSTVMKSKSGTFSVQTLGFLASLKEYFKLGIISNNYSEEYIEKASSQVDFIVVGAARKPDTKVVLDVCNQMQIEPEKCAFVGDRPLTDILCAKRAKMLSILVDSISKNEEHKIVRFVRFLERLTIRR